MNGLNKYSFILYFFIFILFLLGTHPKIPSFIVEDINGKTIDLASTRRNNLIICYHNYNCVDCFSILQKLKKKYKGFRLCFLARSKTNQQQLKRMIEFEIKKNLRKFYKKEFVIYYDLHKEVDPWPPVNLQEGIFAKYKITKTPAYFILTKDTLIFVPYEQIEKEMYK